MNGVFLETGRLILRRLTETDFPALHGVLSKESVMYAWEHGFSEEESFDFLHRMMRRYETDGYAYFAAIEKDGGAFLGVIGLLTEEIAGEACIGVGYILQRSLLGKRLRRRRRAGLSELCFFRSSRAPRYRRHPSGKHCFPPGSGAPWYAGRGRIRQILLWKAYAAHHLCGISAGFTRCKECGILTAIDRSKGSAHNDRDVVFQEKSRRK